jgi:hypothetical protein
MRRVGLQQEKGTRELSGGGVMQHRVNRALNGNRSLRIRSLPASSKNLTHVQDDDTTTSAQPVPPSPGEPRTSIHRIRNRNPTQNPQGIDVASLSLLPQPVLIAKAGSYCLTCRSWAGWRRAGPACWPSRTRPPVQAAGASLLFTS